MFREFYLPIIPGATQLNVHANNHVSAWRSWVRKSSLVFKSVVHMEKLTGSTYFPLSSFVLGFRIGSMVRSFYQLQCWRSVVVKYIMSASPPRETDVEHSAQSPGTSYLIWNSRESLSSHPQLKALVFNFVRLSKDSSSSYCLKHRYIRWPLHAVENTTSFILHY